MLRIFAFALLGTLAGAAIWVFDHWQQNQIPAQAQQVAAVHVSAVEDLKKQLSRRMVLLEGQTPQLLQQVMPTPWLNSGKPVLVNFWASWCPPCVRELPDLLTLARKGSIYLVLVNYGEEEAVISKFKNEYNWAVAAEDAAQLLWLNDPQRNMAALFNVRQIPETIIIQNNSQKLKIRGEAPWKAVADAQFFLAPEHP